MFECKYKYELEDSIISAKYVYKSQRRTQDKVIAILLPILMVCMIAMLVFDIVKGNSFVWDVVLLVALFILEVMYAVIPITLVHSQKKAFKSQNLEEMDYIQIIIDDNTCTERLIKGEEEKTTNQHSLKMLTSYLEDDNRIILVFNKVEFVCLRKENIIGDVNKLKAHLQKVMAKTSRSKK